MNIFLKTNYGISIAVDDAGEGVSIEEDIEVRNYGILPDGKVDWRSRKQSDISDSSMNKIVRLLDDMVDYRITPYNSKDLVVKLFDKLPFEVIRDTITELTEIYNDKKENIL